MTRTLSTLIVTTAFLFAGSPANASDGWLATEAAARGVSTVETRLTDKLQVSDAELTAMHYAIQSYIHQGGEPQYLVDAVGFALDNQCWGTCLVFVADGMTTAMRAGLQDTVALDLVQRTLVQLDAERRESPVRWTDVHHGTALRAEVIDRLEQWSKTHPETCSV